MRKSVLNGAVVAGVAAAMAFAPSQAMGAVTHPAAADRAVSAQPADCAGAEDRQWVEISGFVRTIYYTNCRDETVTRRAYVYDLVPMYLDCKSVPPGATVSWTTSFFPIGWGVAAC